jgi:hypothetical protein
MKTLIKIMILSISILALPIAGASMVICTATCVLDSNGKIVTVQGKGLDIQDAVTELKERCDDAAAVAKSPTHYLATSFSKPTAQYTSTQTDFDVQKACL